MGVQIFKDFKNGAPPSQKALDILDLVVTTAQIVVAVVASLLPPVL